MRRPNQHVLEDKSRNYVSKIVTDKGWIYRDRQKDYGIDAEFEVVRDGHVTGEIIFVQLKATNRFENRIEKTISLRCKVDHVRYWLSLPVPVILVVYVEAIKQAYWVCVQQYVSNSLDIKNPFWSDQKYVTVYFPKSTNLIKTFDNIELLPSQHAAITRHNPLILQSDDKSTPPIRFTNQVLRLLDQKKTYDVLSDVVGRLNLIERGIVELRNTTIVRRHFEDYLRAETIENFGVNNVEAISKVFLEPSISSRFTRMKVPSDHLVIKISENLKRITFTTGKESWSVDRPERLLDCSCRYTPVQECPLHSKISKNRFAALWKKPVEIQHLGTHVLYQGAPKYPAAWPPSLESLKFGTEISQYPKVNGGRVIDIGCGTGYLGLLAAELLCYDEVTFLDWMPSALVMASINMARSRALKRLKYKLKAKVICNDGLRSLCNKKKHYELLLCNPPFLPELGVAEMRTIHSVFGTDLLTEVLKRGPELADVCIVAYSSLVSKEVEPLLAKIGSRFRILNPNGFEMPFSVNYAFDSDEYMKLLIKQGRLSEFSNRRHKYYHKVYFLEVLS